MKSRECLFKNPAYLNYEVLYVFISMCIFGGIIINPFTDSLSMELIGARVQGGLVRWGGGVFVVKVYGQESASIRGHLRGWSPCSHSGQMLQDTLSAQMANAWSVLFKGHSGPPGAWKLLREPHRPLPAPCPCAEPRRPLPHQDIP